MDYLFIVLNYFLFMAVLAVSLEPVVSGLRLLSMAQGAFAAIGGYSVAILSTKLNVPLWVGLLVGILFAGMIGAMLMAVCDQLMGDMFTFATFAFSLIFLGLVTEATELTGGVNGIASISGLEVFFKGYRPEPITTISFSIILASSILFWRKLDRSPWGLTMRSIGSSRGATEFMGVDIKHYRIWTMALSSGWAALAGGMWAISRNRIHPDQFDTMALSFWLSAVVMLGGYGRWKGALLGTGIVFLIEECVQIVPLGANIKGYLPRLVAAIGLLILLWLRRDGTIGRHARWARLVSHGK